MNFEKIYQEYVKILKEELLPAMGCTEPIAVAYAASMAKEILGVVPEEAEVCVSNNIIKNVKSVLIPNTGGLKGLEAAAAAGIAVGRPEKKLEVIADVDDTGREKIRQYLKEHSIRVTPSDSGEIFDILITVKSGESEAKVRIVREHTNIVLLEKDGKILYQAKERNESVSKTDAYACLNIEDIICFADTTELDEIGQVIERQIEYNYTIAEEGIRSSYGAEIGRTILEYAGDDVRNKAKAMAAAGSDARMSGCELPVVIVGGSGNQGITASVPIVVYAKEKGCSHEKLIRAVILSDLLSIYQRSLIGRLSAYCGAVNAGCAAASGIAYLEGRNQKEIVHTLINSLAAVSGIICDGAKPSCAAKIAASVEAGLLGYDMYKKKRQFRGGEGIVTKNADETVHNIGILGKEGMRATDEKIIEIMMKCVAE